MALLFKRQRMKKIKFLPVVLIFMAMIIPVSCKKNIPADLTAVSIIPKPVSVTATGEAFILNSRTAIFVDAGSDEILRTGQYLADKLNYITGLSIDVKEVRSVPAKRSIFLTLSDADRNLGEEGYTLTITRQQVKLSAVKPAGIFRGIQTLRQIAKRDTISAKKEIFLFPSGTISDHPEFSYRSMMLDVSRHFFVVEDVKQVIEYLAFYKINTFHLHLSDDQGWRIEIKAWPNLTAHGGSTRGDP